MDQLRKGISLRAYGQVDPVISYKQEGFEMFDEMVARIQRTTISTLLKVRVEARPAPVQMNIAPKMQAAAPAPAEAPAQESPAQAQPAQATQAAPARPFRRQMPESITNMSSFKEAVAAMQARMEAQKAEETTAEATENEEKTENE
jgi:preprotein translocase subunit SecA